MSAPLVYRLTAGLDTDGVIAALSAHAILEEEPPERGEWWLYDTFDWRLYRSGQIVVARRAEAGAGEVRWQSLDGRKRLGTIATGAAPRFVREIGDEELRARLEPVVEMRALLCQARVAITARRFRVETGQGELALRCEVGEYATLPGAGVSSGRPIGRLLRVRPVAGREAELRVFLKVVGSQLDVEPADGGVLGQALAVAGKMPGSYEPKTAVPLEPGMPAETATRMVLARQLDVMLANEAGLRADTDTEFNHDFRVAVRRTRSLLTQIKGVFAPVVRARWSDEFRWLGTVTSPLRDLDVYLLLFEGYRQTLPARLQPDLEPLRGHLLERHAAAHAGVVAALDSDRYRDLIREWRAFLTGPALAGAVRGAPRAQQPIHEVHRLRTWKVYRRVLREGMAIEPGTAPGALHELRKTCKKLRYLIELYRTLYPSKAVRSAVRIVKRLQTNLGDLQDLEVHADAIERFAEEMAAAGTATPRALLAMGALVADLERRQRVARAEFADTFAWFATRAHRAEFEALLGRQGDRRERKGKKQRGR